VHERAHLSQREEARADYRFGLHFPRCTAVAAGVSRAGGASTERQGGAHAYFNQGRDALCACVRDVRLTGVSAGAVPQAG
jgi:hypothetical protein